MPRFYEYEGDLIGLVTDENHVVYRWIEKDCKILFSVARLGDGCSCHFASDKAGLRHIKQAINEFCQFLFDKFNWCTMILAKTKRPSVGRLIEKCGFSFVVQGEELTAYARCRDGWNS